MMKSQSQNKNKAQDDQQNNGNSKMTTQLAALLRFYFFILLALSHAKAVNATNSLINSQTSAFDHSSESASAKAHKNARLKKFKMTFSEDLQNSHNATPDLSRSIFPLIIFLPNIKILATTFYIGDNRFVTNLHTLYKKDNSHNLIPSADRFYFALSTERAYIYYNGQYFPFQKVIATDKEDDLAVLELNSDNYKETQSIFVPLKLNPDQDFSSVSFYGFNFSNFQKNEIEIQTYTHKSVSIFHYLWKIIFYTNVNRNSIVWNHNNQIKEGMSGSPLMNDGQVVGILRTSGEHTFTGAHVSRLILLLENQRAEEDHYP